MMATAPMGVRSFPDVVPPEDRTLGWEVLQWCANYLKQPDGPNAGDPWEFTVEQAKIILRWYAIDNDGRFLYRRGVIRRMKGWGKSPFCAALSAVELCGPCRFGGWDQHGKPIVIKHSAPWIQIAAVSQEQTKNTTTVFPGLFTDKALQEYDIDLGKFIIYAHHGAGRIEAVTSSVRPLEGGRPSLVVADETAHWVPSGDGPAMMAAIQRNLGKSRDQGARVIEITNAHLVDEQSVAELTYEAWRKSDGGISDVYYDALEAPAILDPAGQHVPLAEWTDSQIKDALISARADSTWLDVSRLLAEIRDPSTSESLARRFYLNQVWAGVNEEWLPVGSWAAVERTGPVPPGADVILGVDGSFNDDSTGVVVASCGETPHIDVVGVWEPDPTSEELRTVPIDEVEKKIRDACRTWRVREIVFDPYRWARTMQALLAEGLPVVEYPQSPERMVTACQRFQTAVVNGTLTHSGNLALARHVGNAVVRENSRGKRIVKETKWSPRKIDLAVAAVMAHDRAAGRPSVGAGWLSYMRQQLSRQEMAPVRTGEYTGVTVTASGELTIKDVAPVTSTRASTCKHRWMREAWGSYCLLCQERREV